MGRLDALPLKPGDTLTVVDNTPGRPADEPFAGGRSCVIRATEVAAPGYARNRGAACGSAEWLLFIDADVAPAADLVERYFESPAAEGTGLIAGEVADEAVDAGGPAGARYAYMRGLMGQEDTFRFGSWGFPKTANVVCRRAAFEEVGGFREDIRAGEDADLTYRLRAAGWEIERRDAALVTHHNRQTARAFAAQKLCHGASIAWLNREYVGSFPSRRRPGLVWWAIRRSFDGLRSAARDRDRDEALWAVFDPLELLAVEFGRSLPNERPLSARVLRRHLENLRERPGARRMDGSTLEESAP